MPFMAELQELHGCRTSAVQAAAEVAAKASEAAIHAADGLVRGEDEAVQAIHQASQLRGSAESNGKR